MIRGETLNFLAIELDETMKKSAPLIRKTNPVTKTKACRKICMTCTHPLSIFGLFVFVFK